MWIDRTMGQAVDVAVAHHEKRYTESKVFHISGVRDASSSPSHRYWRVELSATHFSYKHTYHVSKDPEKGVL